MMQLLQVAPSPPLREFIRMYRLIEFSLPDMKQLPPKAYPPRPEICLQFFLTPGHFFYPGSDDKVTPKYAILFGQHSTITNRVVNERLESLQVIFTMAGFYRLTGIPASVFYNSAVEASEIFGREIDLVTEKMHGEKTNKGRYAVIEAFLNGLVKRSRIEPHPIDDSCEQIHRSAGELPLDYFVQNSCLSHRQFDRKFVERTGTGAKELMRVARFYEAYLLKNKNPDRDWLYIALHCGYHDYQHLARDYRAFTGMSPAQFFRLDSPERALGKEEVYTR